MKLDKIRFARLISHIQYWVSKGHMISECDIEDVDNLCQFEVPEAPVHATYPSTSDINVLMFLMAEGTRKIEAIKTYRNLTGRGLMESKNLVEKYWVSKDHQVPLAQEPSRGFAAASIDRPSEATLGDILATATK